MSARFHVAQSGEPALCRASVRSCPRGGEEAHFATVEEAMEYSMRQAVEADMEAFYEDHSWTDEAMQEMDAHLSATEAFEGGQWAAYELPDEDDDLADRLAEMEFDEWANEHLPVLPENPPLDDDAYEAYENDLEAAESVVQRSIQETKDFFNSMPSEWAVEFLDEEEAVAAAAALNSREGRRILHAFADDLEKELTTEFQAGRLTREAYDREMEPVQAVRFLLTPYTGRSRFRSEPKPIDPQLIQALRLLYIKKFGQDPFEKGVTVPQLLEMRRQKQI